MTGMSRDTGTRIAFDAHLSQSIMDILLTPRGTRVMRRAYGSDLPALIDAPMNGETLVDLFMGVAEALDRWEPRFTLSRVQVLAAAPGRLTLTLEGAVIGRSAPVALELELAA
ncbi:MAG: GPW/gp25 family protein [Rhodobacteraceae bacterium]|nr:GPW/gp25 family protein [Paracoccaceae bacterium]